MLKVATTVAVGVITVGCEPVGTMRLGPAPTSQPTAAAAGPVENPSGEEKPLSKNILRIIENHKLTEWRNQLPNDYQVYLLDSEPNWRYGSSHSDIGIKTRQIPKMEGPYGDPPTWLQKGKEIYWQTSMEIRLVDSERTAQEWAIIFFPELTEPLFVPIGPGLLFEGRMYDPTGKRLDVYWVNRPVQKFEWTPRG